MSAFDLAYEVSDHAPCIRIAASYPAQLAVAYRNSEGKLDPEEARRSLVVRGSSWNDCPGKNDQAFMSLIPDAHLGLTNVSKTEELNRTIFFAGGPGRRPRRTSHRDLQCHFQRSRALVRPPPHPPR